MAINLEGVPMVTEEELRTHEKRLRFEGHLTFIASPEAEYLVTVNNYTPLYYAITKRSKTTIILLAKARD